MASEDAMKLATTGLVDDNTKEEVPHGKPSFLQSVSFRPPACVYTERSHLTTMPVIQDEHEKCNGWITTCELVNRAALGIAWVPGYIWEILGLATAHGEMRQTGDDPNIGIPSSNLEVPEPDVGWERN